MVADGLFTKGLGNPAPRGMGVGHRLDGGESLRCDDEKGSRGRQTLQRVIQMGPVDIGDKMEARAGMVGRKRQCCHRGPEIGAANADIDDIGKEFAR